MNCEEIKNLMMGYIDGELSDEQKSLVEKHIEECEKCRDEYKSFVRIKEVTEDMRLADLKEDIWAGYWKGVYKRIERGAGWIFLSIGAIILLAFGMFEFIKSIIFDPSLSLIVKIGIFSLTLGVVILLVSILRERLFAFKKERYRDIER